MSPRMVLAALLGLLLAACGSPASGPDRDGAAAEPPARGTASPPATAGAADAASPGRTPSEAGTSAGPPSPSASPAAVASCAPAERLPIQGGEHLIGDSAPPVPYNSSPPTSGWHASGAFNVAVQPVDQPLSEPLQVSVLEAGGVVVTYKRLQGADRTALEQHVNREHHGRVAVTPYDALQHGQVAFTAWGVLQRCQGVDLAALDTFVQAHAEADVQPGHGH